MKKILRNALDTLSEDEKTAFRSVVQKTLEVYRAHPTLLPLRRFREQVALVDKDVASLLDLIYTHRVCTRSSLLRRGTQRIQDAPEVVLSSSFPDLVEKVLVSVGYDASHQVISSDMVGLFAKGQ